MLSGRSPTGKPSLSHTQHSELTGTVLFFSSSSLVCSLTSPSALPPQASSPCRFSRPTVLNARAHLVRERFSTEPSVQGWDGVVGDRLDGRHDERVVQELASVVDERDVAHQCVDVALNLRR